MPAKRIPSYRLHKATGQAVVVLDGTSHYLGKFNTPQSKTLYDRVVADWLARKANTGPRPATPDTTPAPRPGLTVNELVLAYWRFAKRYYVKDGKPTGEQWPLRQALRLLRGAYGDTPACEFGPRALRALQEALVTQPITRRFKTTATATGEARFEVRVVRVGLSRRCINKQIGRVRRVFGWAVAEELLPVEVHEALRRVEGLKKGRSAAREKPRVGPVPDDQVAAVLPHVPPAVRAMIEVQRLTGCRPQEVVQMRGDEIDTGSAIWEYRPRTHKAEHRGGEDAVRERVVFVGPMAQELLRPFLATAGGGFLFSPRRSEEQRNRRRREGRTSPVTPSQQARGACGDRKRPPREHYDVAGYRKAIRRACGQAGVPVWSPNRLRHSAGTAIRRRFGLEASQAVLGHAELGVTQVYAEVDREAARKVMEAIG